jgi:hypothetical protein
LPPPFSNSHEGIKLLLIQGSSGLHAYMLVGFAGRKYIHELPQPQKAKYSPLAIIAIDGQAFAAAFSQPTTPII